MDAHTFDRWTAGFALTPTRREALRLLSGLGLAGVLGRAEAEAKKKRKKKKKKKNNNPVLPPTRQVVTRTFTNASPIFVPGLGLFGVANPYPSPIDVSGFTNGTITDVNVFLNDVSHTFSRDIDILLAATHLPGRNAVLMSDIGNNVMDIVHVNLVLDDQAAASLPADSPPGSGTYRPFNNADPAPDTFPPDAPPLTGNSLLSTFNGQNPNGTWQLFVLDDGGGDTGNIAGGWALQISAEVDV